MIRRSIPQFKDESGFATIEVVMLIGFAAIAGVFVIKLGQTMVDWMRKVVQLVLFS